MITTTAIIHIQMNKTPPTDPPTLTPILSSLSADSAISKAYFSQIFFNIVIL